MLLRGETGRASFPRAGLDGAMSQQEPDEKRGFGCAYFAIRECSPHLLKLLIEVAFQVNPWGQLGRWQQVLADQLSRPRVALLCIIGDAPRDAEHLLRGDALPEGGSVGVAPGGAAWSGRCAGGKLAVSRPFNTVRNGGLLRPGTQKR